MIIVTGPEGSGTQYTFKALASANDLPRRINWGHSIFNGKNTIPDRGIHHVSLPCLRPARWLSELNLPDHVKIVALIRKKHFAVRSAHRRFKNIDRTPDFEALNYDRALAEIEQLKKRYQVLTIAYEDLGGPETRSQIEEFCGLEASWEKFQNANTA